MTCCSINRISETQRPITQKVKRRKKIQRNANNSPLSIAKKKSLSQSPSSSNSSELVSAIQSMEALCTSFTWEFFSHQEDGMEDLRRALLYTTLELETTIVSAKEELLRRECEIMNLKDLLNRAVKEKDEVETKCGELMFENLVLLQQQHKNQESEVTPQSDSDSSKIFACSDSDDSTIQSAQTDLIVVEPLVSQECPPTVWENVCESEKPLLSQEIPQTVWKNACENEKSLLSQEIPPSVWKNACEKPLPQKGKLLQAVIEAGPLLQNLLLAGPLPHWQHPPPLVDSVDIPPVIISPHSSQPPAQSTSIDIRKRSHSFLSDASQHSHKQQKMVQ